MSAIKKMIGRIPNYSSEQIIKRIGDHSCVSFDIFDTLIKRAVPKRSDVFEVAAEGLREGISIDAVQFKLDRVVAERMARAQAKAAGREEVTLEEIYKYLPENYAQQRNCLMKLEIAQEKSCCHINPVMKDVYLWCKENHRRIFIISDMYLPVNVIEDILEMNGVTGYERLFLSSEESLTKKSGALYAEVLRKTGIDPAAVVHIGDHPFSDYLQAKKAGIASILIAHNPKRTKFTRFHALSGKSRGEVRQLECVINGCISPDWDPYYQFGFEVLGPIVYGFSTWLHEDAKKRGIEKLFFLSRDGYLLQQAYQLLYGEKGLPHGYLHISRKALHTPCFWMTPELEAIMSAYSPYKKWNCQLLCELLGIDEGQGMAFWRECGLTEDQYFMTSSLVKNKNVLQFYSMVQNTVIERSKTEYAALMEYLKQNTFSGKIGIIDVGWVGTMQNCLERVLSDNVTDTTIRGYYVGLSDRAPDTLNAAPYISKALKPKAGCAGLIEFFFPAQEGSTKGYCHCDGTVEPVLFPYEYEGKEKELYARSEIQAGAMEFVRIFKMGMGLKSLTGEAAYANLRSFGRMPRRKDRDLFGTLMFMDGELHPLAAPKSLIYYLLHPKELLSDFLNSRWKCGFARELFKLPLPYHWAFILLEK